MLDADAMVRQGLWDSDGWRGWKLEHGRLTEAGREVDGEA
jgi:hypothetical protein